MDHERLHTGGALCVATMALALLGNAPVEQEFAATYSQYAVAADHHAASAAGAEVLARGGNAADAAAATMLALGVVNPASSGIGGGGFALYYCAADKVLTFLDFRERAPASATRTMFQQDESRPSGPANAISQLGGLATGVPGEPAGIERLVDQFGQLSLKEVVAPALRLAQQGVPVTRKLAASIRAFAVQLERDPVLRQWVGLKEGDNLTRPELARVLDAFSSQGARAIYHGALAERLVQDVQAQGGIMTLQDLRDYRVVVRAPLGAEHFGFLWVSAPPPSAGGFTMLQSLGILERIPQPQRTGPAPWLHALVESWKGPFADRRLYFGDPDHVLLPLRAMMAEPRVARRASFFDPDHAQSAQRYELPIEDRPSWLIQPDTEGTSHLCVTDQQGNVAAVTTTVNLPFGARYVAAGMVMNDEMDDFARAPGGSNAFGLVGGMRNLPGPRKRPVSTMSPTIVFKDGIPVLCAGASGGSRIVTATQQVALNVLLRGMTARAAVAAPRVHHQGSPPELRVEEVAPIPAEVRAALEARGHVIAPIYNVANVQMIHIRQAGGARVFDAVSDPRKGGAPAGK